MKLYAVHCGPPSLGVKQALKHLNIPYELKEIDYGAGDHLTEEYTKMNPQKEIPVLNDDGFFLGESNAILQYICDKYKPDDSLYPKDPKVRAVINHHLCFNLSTYYRYICEYSMDPAFYGYERTSIGLKKVHIALDNFNTYLNRQGTKYAAADHLTIADFPLINSTMCLEAIAFDFSKYDLISKWYSTFKKEYPDLWEISAVDLKSLSYLMKNPPDYSHLNHPFHPMQKCS